MTIDIIHATMPMTTPGHQKPVADLIAALRSPVAACRIPTAKISGV